MSPTSAAAVTVDGERGLKRQALRSLKATIWANTPHKGPCTPRAWRGHVHRCWMDISARRSQPWHSYLGTLDVWDACHDRRQQQRLKRQQMAADGDDEAVHVRLCLTEILFGPHDLRNWKYEAHPSALLLLWTVVVSTTLWLDPCPHASFLWRRDVDRKHSHSNKVWFDVERSSVGVVLRLSWVTSSRKNQMLHVLRGTYWFVAYSDGS